MKGAGHKASILYIFIYMKCAEQANPQRQKTDQYLSRAVGGTGVKEAGWGEIGGTSGGTEFLIG